MTPTTSNILDLPIAQFLGIERSERENACLQIEYRDDFRNHIDTFHAAALFSFAELSAGYFLAESFPKEQETTIPVIRRSNVKYSIQGKGRLHSYVRLIDQTEKQIKDTIYNKGHVMLDLWVEVRNESKKLVFSGNFEWFVPLKSKYLKISKTAVGSDN